MSTDLIATPRKVKCPGCGEHCAYSTENPFRPFCSARCKTNDFGCWASERFSVDADAVSTEIGSDLDRSTESPESRKH